MSTPRDLFPDLYPNYKRKPAHPAKTSATNDAPVEPEDLPSPMKVLWCNTQWSNLSLQAMNMGLPTLPYFDPKTMLLSKEVNVKLWKQLVYILLRARPHPFLNAGDFESRLRSLLGSQEKLYSALGPDTAVHASPKMLDGGEVVWHSFSHNDKGEQVEVFEEAKYRGWSDSTTK